MNASSAAITIGKHRRPGAGRLSWGVFLLSVAYALLLVTAMVIRPAPASLGFEAHYQSAAGAWVVAEVAPLSLASDAGLLPGDRLVLVDGAALPPDEAAGRALLARALAIQVSRPGLSEPLTVSNDQPGTRTPNRASFIMISLLFFGVGAAALIWGRGPAPRALALVCCAGAGGLATVPPLYQQESWAVLLYGALAPLFVGGFAYLFLVFPVERRVRIGRRAVPAWLVLLPAPLLALASAVLVGVPVARQTMLYPFVKWFGYAYFLSCFVGGVSALGYSWRHSRTPRERRQLRIVLLGSVCAVLPFVLLSVLPEAVIGRNIVAPELTILALGALPAAFGYAILRYQLMDLQLYLRRGLVYSVIVATVTGSYALALVAVTIFVEERTATADLIVIAIVATLVALAGQPLRDAVQRAVDRLFDRRRYDYRQQLLEFSQRMSSILDAEELARSTTGLIAQTMGATHVRLYLYESQQGGYRLWSATDAETVAAQQRLPGDSPVVRELAGSAGVVQHPDVPPTEDAVLLTLRNKGNLVALLTLGPKVADVPYSSEDLSLLRTIANQLAIATENAQLYNRMRELYLSSIRSLAATVDAKDAYTHGHSERVAAYARTIAATLRLSQLEVETIELAALLHDIGKIGIPDAVLLKQGRLEPAEREIMKQHAALGAEILAGSPVLAPLVPLVRHHHERYGGGGYPDGLVGDAVPLGAAIICVADTFDTMTTDRPYRRAPGWEAASSEIQRLSGAQFRPDVVAAFFRAAQAERWMTSPVQATVSALGNLPATVARLPADAEALGISYQITHLPSEKAGA